MVVDSARMWVLRALDTIDSFQEFSCPKIFVKNAGYGILRKHQGRSTILPNVANEMHNLVGIIFQTMARLQARLIKQGDSMQQSGNSKVSVPLHIRNVAIEIMDSMNGCRHAIDGAGMFVRELTQPPATFFNSAARQVRNALNAERYSHGREIQDKFFQQNA